MKIKKNIIIEDSYILKNIGVSYVADTLGMDRSYISKIKHGHIIASEELYFKIKEVVDKYHNVV